ncbi:MAG: hypothetical protein BWY55_00230 [archaeon ADurb.Bin336]|nr:MAG: hypothetical protein BWY55_00230 [archaeon ADurb.Bin336]
MKVIELVVISLLLISLSGCTFLGDDSLQKMDALQQKYFVKSGYSSSVSSMTEYISSLSELNKSAGMEGKKIIQAEIYLAESFVYQNKALIESTKVDYVNINCSLKETRDLINYIELAEKSVNLAKDSYSSLNESQRKNLRENYSNLLNGFEENILTMKNFMDKKC